MLENAALIQWGVVIGASLIAAVMDYRTRRIPNILCGPVLLAGLVFSFWQNGFEGLLESVAGCLILACPFVILFIIAHGGAGDAKLMGAVGSWLGVRQGVIVLVCVIIAGGILAILTAILKKKLKVIIKRFYYSFYIFAVTVSGKKGKIITAAKDAQPSETEKLTMPYGIAILAGVCIGAGIIWLRG